MSKKLDIEKTRIALQAFEFGELFREELGWSSPKSSQSKTESLKDITFTRKPIAELSGAVVFEITLVNGELPDSSQRKELAKFIRSLHFENVCIFIDAQRSQSIWHWAKKQDKRMMAREHFYMRGQPGDLFITKLSSLVVDLSDFDREGNIPIAEVASRMKAALDVEVVTKKFYKSYQEEFNGFVEFIEGISDENDRRWYASVILNRLMFIYFLQRKFFLDNGNPEYLSSKLEYSKNRLGKNKYYEEFLKRLFFEGFAKEEEHRSAETNKLIGTIKYLNGGLFLQHKIEKKYNGRIKIKDVAFENLFTLFKSYSWNLNDTPGGQDNELNPDVLGYIFEKYINQKAFGAYYTRTEITEYLCEQTIYKLILDAINGPDTSAYDELIENTKKTSAYLSKPTPLSKKNKVESKRKHYERVEDLLIDLDADICRKLVVGENAVLPNLSLLDPACGSGAFLVAAMKTLINIYAAVLGKIEFLGDKKLKEWLKEIEDNHPSVNYYIKKQIITNNLYGVDIMEEASEIAKLRLFLALVASAQKVDDLEPLPNIDFNIMTGNSLIGLMRVDENEYNSHQKGDMFKKSYGKLIQEREAAIRGFKIFEGDREVLQAKKEAIERLESEANETLNLMLGQEFNNLGIKYEQQTWDKKKKEVGKPVKRSLTKRDIENLDPFHWGYEFSEIFRKKNGFDAIIANPPWEVFKPNAKEFFAEHSNIVTKKKMTIKEFEKEQEKLLQDPEVQVAWLEYLSKFPHLSSYYRNTKQYINQISIINGKKAGSDINLYKLFTEQCYNLLKDGGYCGIVIPSAIYAGLGTMQLRKMLFEKTRISQLISLSNEKFIFENVHHAFKLCFLSFEKGHRTRNFSAIFRIDPREAVKPNDLEYLFSAENEFIQLSPEMIQRLSPDSLSIMEFHGEIDKTIVDKMLTYPPLGQEVVNSWNLKIGSEFHMTGDSYLFKTKPQKNSLPLYEGKMINQFEHNTSLAKYWIDEKAGRKALVGKRGIDDGQALPYQNYRLGFRAVAGNTNIRTIIVGPIPQNVFCGNSLLVSEGLNGKDLIYAQALLNSFVVDYYARQMVTTNINMFYIYQLPVPRLAPSDKRYKVIVEKAAKLICTDTEFEPLWEEVTKQEWKPSEVVTSENERSKLRAELDGIIAHVYNLNAEEFEYILNAFPVVPEEQRTASLKAYKDLALQFQNTSAVRSPDTIDLIAKGEHKNLEFKSTLCYDLKDNTRKTHIEHSVLKTIAAFLNTDGGILLIGVTDDGQIHGLEDDFKVLGSKGDPRDNFNKAFDNLITNNFGNPIHRLVDLSLEPIDGKLVAKVIVQGKAPEEVFLVNKDKNSVEEFYVRQNSRSVVLTGKDLTKYIKEHWK